MNRVIWILVASLVVLACRSELDQVPPELDVAPNRDAMVERAGPIDPVVTVTGRSTVFVIQGDRVRAALEWPHQKGGRVTVPLKSVDDGSGPLYVRVVPDSMSKFLTCPPCKTPGGLGPEMEPCCW